jgi:restriction system protein
MAIPDFQTLMKPLLVLSQNEQKFQESIAQVSEDFSLTEEERDARVPSGRMSLMQNRVAWAITYLFKAGLVERKKRGYFSITESGQKTIEEDPEKITIAYLMQFPSFVEFRSQRKKGSKETAGVEVVDISILTPIEQIAKSHEELQGEVEQELLDRILSQSPEFFERLVVELLKAMGYAGDEFIAEAVGKSGDGGIDGIIHQDSLGLEAVYIQAKRYDPSNSVGRPALQAFIGSLSGMSASKGVFITTSSFSSNVEPYLQSVPQRVITIDGNRLVELMVQHGVGVRKEQTYTVYRVDEDFFVDD